MDTKEILVEAARIVDDIGLPDELRAVGFGKAIDLVARAKAPPGDASYVETSDELGSIALKLGLPEESVHGIYHRDGDALGIGVAPVMLEKSPARATKQLALLLAAGRQAGGYDEGWTTVGRIRDVCREFGRLDAPNFAGSITEMTDVFTFRGKGTKREVHLTQPGWERARDLIRSLITSR
jgi:hypothetical protein